MDIFYQKDIELGINRLNEEESRHCLQVLRHQKGDEILIFDGIGGKHRSVLTQVSKKSCDFEVVESKMTPKKNFRTHLLIAPTKNADRMEWLIEKLSEIGVDEITLIETKHSERRKMRIDRLEKKAISAMKQSGNPYLLKLNAIQPLDQAIKNTRGGIKLIAHVSEDYQYISDQIDANSDITILIGPEGDFSVEEVKKCIASGFNPVSLGNTTLRTETAGFLACCCVNFVNRA